MRKEISTLHGHVSRASAALIALHSSAISGNAALSEPDVYAATVTDYREGLESAREVASVLNSKSAQVIDTLDPKDRRKYADDYEISVTNVMQNFDISAAKLAPLLKEFARIHIDFSGCDHDRLRLPSVGTLHTWKQRRIVSDEFKIRFAYLEATSIGRPVFGLIVDGGKKGRRQHMAVNVIFWSVKTGKMERYFLGAPEATGTSSTEQWLPVRRVLETFGIPLLYGQHLTSDAGDKSVNIMRMEKQELIQTLLDNGEVEVPAFMHSASARNFVVKAQINKIWQRLHSGQDLSWLPGWQDPSCLFRQLIDRRVFHWHDPPHKSKNGELACIGKLGKYVMHPLAFKNHGDSQERSVVDVLLSFCRLFAKDMKLIHICRSEALPGEPKLQMVPRAVKHRLKAMPLAAYIADTHIGQIIRGLTKYMNATAVTATNLRPKKHWSEGGVPASCGQKINCTHALDVVLSLKNPRLRLEIALFAKTYTPAQNLYAACQRENGIQAFRGRGIMHEYRGQLQRLQGACDIEQRGQIPPIIYKELYEASTYFPDLTAVDSTSAGNLPPQNTKVPSPLQSRSIPYRDDCFFSRNILEGHDISTDMLKVALLRGRKVTKPGVYRYNW